MVCFFDSLYFYLLCKFLFQIHCILLGIIRLNVIIPIECQNVDK